MKKITYVSVTNPTDAPVGFPDYVLIHKGDKLLYQGNASIMPNGFHPDTNRAWYHEYGWVADGYYSGMVVNHSKWGKCILWEEGKKIPSRTANPNHGGSFYLTQIFSHPANIGGKNPEWRGSAGCATHHRQGWDEFKSFFKLNEIVDIEVITVVPKEEIQ